MPYKAYFKAAPAALIIVDPKGFIVEANAAGERLFGYSNEELVGQPVELLVPQQIRELHARHVQDYFAAPRTRAMGLGLSLAGRRKDGSEFPVEIGLTYSKDTLRGELVVAAVVDISQRLALELQARRIETLTSLGTFASGIVHDLNNPLQVIRSRLELLLESPDDMPASEMMEDHVTIYRQAQRVSAILEEFLKLSRQREKVLARVNINEVVDRALLLIGEQLRKSDIELKTHLDRSLPEIRGDAIGLERVLINLLTNAYEAMPQGGSITVTSRWLTDEQSCLELTVADTGPGIPPDSLKKLFTLTYTTKPAGSGLGLWFSRRIIHEHNGAIEVHSEVGKGTRFTISLPTSHSPE